MGHVMEVDLIPILLTAEPLQCHMGPVPFSPPPQAAWAAPDEPAPRAPSRSPPCALKAEPHLVIRLWKPTAHFLERHFQAAMTTR